jgi:ribosome-associated protein
VVIVLSDYEKSFKLVTLLCAAAHEAKAEDLLVLDVSKISGFTDYFIIMSGRSTRHVQGLASALDKQLGGKRLKVETTEGLADGQWVLLDFGDVVVHIFYKDTREFYDLEGLWHDAPRIEV